MLFIEIKNKCVTHQGINSVKSVKSFSQHMESTLTKQLTKAVCLGFISKCIC